MMPVSSTATFTDWPHCVRSPAGRDGVHHLLAALERRGAALVFHIDIRLLRHAHPEIGLGGGRTVGVGDEIAQSGDVLVADADGVQRIDAAKQLETVGSEALYELITRCLVSKKVSTISLATALGFPATASSPSRSCCFGSTTAAGSEKGPKGAMWI